MINIENIAKGASCSWRNASAQLLALRHARLTHPDREPHFPSILNMITNNEPMFRDVNKLRTVNCLISSTDPSTVNSTHNNLILHNPIRNPSPTLPALNLDPPCHKLARLTLQIPSLLLIPSLLHPPTEYLNTARAAPKMVVLDSILLPTPPPFQALTHLFPRVRPLL